jgi:DNA-directed RNA polymerase subunit A"
MVKVVDAEFGREAAIDSILKSFVLGVTHLSRTGYTLALEDLNVSDKVKKITGEILENAEKKTLEIIAKAERGDLDVMPGRTMEETRETRLLQVLNDVRTEIAKVVEQNFPADANLSKMIKSKAGGSMLNVTQIGCCVGQQSLWNKRISLGYTDRTLSFFKKKDLGSAAHGFIKSSFFKGLTPVEFFFGAITGRDALMDLALRTPKSGYLYRRLVSALQDLKIEYDGTVRDASENIVQFAYGDDGKDVAKLHLTDDKVSPGEAVGVITAQSFGEASTQMVLNVFHYAGVAQMQITLGLPRLIEILDARKTPSTPLMELYLDKEYNNEKEARILAEKIKEVKLKEIISEIKIDFANRKVVIDLDEKALKSVHAGPQKIVDRLVEKGFSVKGNDLTITMNLADKDFKEIYKLKEKLKDTIISGVKGVSQVVVTQRDRDYVILTAGSNLTDIILVKGVNKDKVFSNDIHDVCSVFGIEAARETIVREIKSVIESQGLDISDTHLKMVADAMTSSGVVKGVTRMGIISDKASILARATFETPDKQFVDATIKGGRDELKSVIENILLNQPIPVGTGLPGLLVKVTGPLANQKSKKEDN